MRSDTHKILLGSDEAPFILKGLRSATIKEPPVAVSINKKPVGDFQGLEVFERVLQLSAYPQTIADIVCNTYFRLTYQKPEGKTATFGTSIIGAVSFRSADTPLHLVPHVTGALVEVGDPHRLKISVAGVYGESAHVSSLRTYAAKAAPFETKMTAEITFSALRDISLDRSRLGNDALRLFTISSMFANPLRYDGSLVRYTSGQDTKSFDLRELQSRERYLFYTPQAASEVELVKGIGSTGKAAAPGSVDSPSIRARILESSVPLSELAIQGYLDSSVNVNDDSLSVWLEWVGCPGVIEKGREISVKVEFSAGPPE